MGLRIPSVPLDLEMEDTAPPPTSFGNNNTQCGYMLAKPYKRGSTWVELTSLNSILFHEIFINHLINGCFLQTFRSG